MNYIIMDLEWNQPVVPKKMMRQSRSLSGDIIQIGAVKTDTELNTIDTFDVIVRPQHYVKMNKRVEEVTGLKDKDIQAGIPFEEAFSAFEKWCGSDFYFITWGPTDVNILSDNLDIYGIDYEIPEDFDAQLMFDEIVMDEGRQYPLNYAIFKYGIKPEMMHSAVNDSINTVEVLRCIGAEDVNEWIEEERAYRAECE